jgi:hypothetical protein
MSATSKARVLWIYPSILLASWLVVRVLAASPAESVKPRATEPSPYQPSVVASTSSDEIRDDSLRELIARFAEAARLGLGRPTAP